MKIGHVLFGKIFDNTCDFIRFLHEQGTFYKILFYKINLTENFTVSNRHNILPFTECEFFVCKQLNIHNTTCIPLVEVIQPPVTLCLSTCVSRQLPRFLVARRVICCIPKQTPKAHRLLLTQFLFYYFWSLKHQIITDSQLFQYLVTSQELTIQLPYRPNYKTFFSHQ